MKFAVVGASLLALSHPAYAQDAEVTDDQASASDDRIVVTARRREENIQDAPVSVVPITGEMLNELNILSFEDIEQSVPGLFLNAPPGGTGESSEARGATFDVQTSASPTIAQYVNEAPVTAQQIFTRPFDVGQIEFLRGPQGTLRGISSPSGSITYTTKRPDLQEFGGFLQATGTHRDAVNVNGGVSIPVIQDVLAFRFAGLYDDNNADQIHSLFSDKNEKNSSQGGRVSARIHPADWLRADFMYQYMETVNRVFDHVESQHLADPTLAVFDPVILPGDRLAIGDDRSLVRNQLEAAIANIEVDVLDHTVTYVGSWSRTDLSAFTPSDNINLFKTINISPVFGGALGPSPLDPSRFGNNINSQSRGISHEVRIESQEPLWDTVDYVVGAFHEDFDGFIPIPQFSTRNVDRGGLAQNMTHSLADVQAADGFLTIVPQLVTVIQPRDETSVFGNFFIHISDDTELSGGLRHIRFDKFSSLSVDLSGLRAHLINSLPPAFQTPAIIALINASAADRSNSVTLKSDPKLVWNAILSHHFTDDLMVYGNVGTSFRGGPPILNIGLPNFQSPRYLDHFSLGDESSRSFELGVKSAWFDDTVILNVSAYKQKYDGWFQRVSVPLVNFETEADFDAAVATGVVPGTAVVSNFLVGSNVPAKVKGVEVDLNYRPSERFNFGTAFSWNDGEIDGGVIPCLDLDMDGVPDSGGQAGLTPQQIFDSTGQTEIFALCTVTQPLSNNANWQVVLRSEYNLPVTDGMDAYLRGQFSYEPDSVNNPNNDFDDIDAYGNLNLYLGLRDADRDWDISFFVKNVSNIQRYESRGAGLVTTQTISVPYRGINLNAPREFGVNVRKRFGGG
jgi:iron complex outermembrane receptor protein